MIKNIIDLLLLGVELIDFNGFIKILIAYQFSIDF